jgi:hypothetical protein
MISDDQVALMINLLDICTTRLSPDFPAVAAPINYTATDLKMELGKNCVKITGYSRSMEPQNEPGAPISSSVRKNRLC